MRKGWGGREVTFPPKYFVKKFYYALFVHLAALLAASCVGPASAGRCSSALRPRCRTHLASHFSTLHPWAFVGSHLYREAAWAPFAEDS